MFSPRFKPRIVQPAASSLHRLYTARPSDVSFVQDPVFLKLDYAQKNLENSLHYDVKCFQILNLLLRHGSVAGAASVPYKFLAGMTLGPGNVRQS
jgi:hypothetical protein